MAIQINPFIFRAYDVRGKVGIDITPRRLRPRSAAPTAPSSSAEAGASSRSAWTTAPPRRPSRRRFAAGVLSTGADLVDIGVNHTPLLYFATAHWKLDGGATVTGSHNPVSDNGVKMVHAGAAPLTEEEIQGLLADDQDRRFRARRRPAHPARPARGVLRGHHLPASTWRGRSRSWWTPATASRAASPPSS